jgi:anti-anti-sigma factor
VIDAARFDIHTEVDDDLASARVSGELDIASLPRLQDAVEELLAGSVSRLAIDLSEVTFVDSSGLRQLIVLASRAEQEGWALSLVPPSGASLAVFELTGAVRNLPFEPPVPDPASEDAAR